MKRYKFPMKFTAFFAACLTAVSCSQETPVVMPEKNPAADEVLVQFRVRTPEAMRVKTRAEARPEESIITSIALLVFKADGTGEYRYQYTAEAEDFDQEDDGQGNFDALLRTSSEPVKLLVIANYPDGLLDDIAASATEDEVRSALTGDYGHLAGFPMTGTKTLPTLTTATGSITIPVQRAVAKITITLSEDVENFTISEAALYRTNDAWQYFPDKGSVSNEENAPVATTASVPSIANGVKRSVTIATLPEYDYYDYLLESDANADPAEATCVVVAGQYGGSDQPTTYYRIDFGSEDDAVHPSGQVLRNFWYDFTIVEVNAAGWDSEEDAAANPATGMSVNPITWDESATEIRFPGTNHAFTVSDRDLTLPYEAGGTETLVVTSSLPFSITFPDAIPVSQTVMSEDLDKGMTFTEMTTSNFIYTIARTAGPDDSAPPVSTYTITALAQTANTTGTNVDRIILTVGGGTMDVFIEQNIEPSAPVLRTLTVLSVGTGPGSLGTNTTAGMNTTNLHATLVNPTYFGPAGTGANSVKLDRLTLKVAATTDCDADADAATFEYLLQSANVLILPSDLTGDIPSAACCEAIVRWMADPGHTLIPVVESLNSNTAIRTALTDSESYTWHDNSDPSVLEGLVGGLVGALTGADYSWGCAPQDYFVGDDSQFITGPFGTVSRGPTHAFEYSAGDYGYVDGIDAETSTLVPIINMAPYGSLLGLGILGANHETSIMSLGVDPSKGIVWMGDAYDMTTSNPTTDGLNRIMGNLWAWIVDRANM